MKALYILLLCLPVITVAQTVEFIEPRTVQEFEEVEFRTIQTDDRVMVVQEMFNVRKPINYDLQVIAYDRNMKLAGSELIDQQALEPGDANNYAGIHVIGGKPFLFKTRYNRDESVYSMYYYPINPDGKRGSGTLLTSYSVERALNLGYLRVMVSPDGKRFVVFGQLPHERRANEKIVIHQYDAAFNHVWTTDYEFPYESSRSASNRHFVNNDGQVFILKKVSERREADYHTVTSFDKQGKPMQEVRLQFDENPVIASYKTGFNTAGDLTLAGVYFNYRRAGINIETPTGVFFARINATDGQIAVQHGHSIRGRENLTVTDVHFESDGSVILTASQISERKSTRTPVTTPPVQDTEYTSAHIYLWKLDEKGEMLWDQRIERRISSKNDAAKTNGVFSRIAGDHIQLIFRDYLHKYDGVNRAVVGPDLANVYSAIVVEIDHRTGAVSNSHYISDQRIGGRRGEYMLIPDTGLQISGNEVWMLAARRGTGRNELVSVKLTF